MLVAGSDALRVGRDPHLDEVHLLRGRGVHLGVLDAGAGAHPLRETRVQLTVIAFGIAVLEPAREHPRDDLHVPVEMRREPAGGRDAIVVAHEQQTVVRVGGVVVAAEAEAVPAVEPIDLRVRPCLGTADVDIAHVSA